MIEIYTKRVIDLLNKYDIIYIPRPAYEETIQYAFNHDYSAQHCCRLIIFQMGYTEQAA